MGDGDCSSSLLVFDDYVHHIDPVSRRSHNCVVSPLSIPLIFVQIIAPETSLGGVLPTPSVPRFIPHGIHRDLGT